MFVYFFHQRSFTHVHCTISSDFINICNFMCQNTEAVIACRNKMSFKNESEHFADLKQFILWCDSSRLAVSSVNPFVCMSFANWAPVCVYNQFNWMPCCNQFGGIDWKIGSSQQISHLTTSYMEYLCTSAHSIFTLLLLSMNLKGNCSS